VIKFRAYADVLFFYGDLSASIVLFAVLNISLGWSPYQYLYLHYIQFARFSHRC